MVQFLFMLVNSMGDVQDKKKVISNTIQCSSSPWIPKFGVSFPCLMNVYVSGKRNSPHLSSHANDRNNRPPNVGIQGDDELCTLYTFDH